MLPDSATLLRDMLDGASQITLLANGMTIDEFNASRAARDAIQWNFLVIGEALSKLRKSEPAVAEQISEWREIIAFRNQLIHGYGVIDNRITFDVIEQNLPVLIRELQELLR